jgi:DNA-directed RNA polymerase specialized sigma24 family protein
MELNHEGRGLVHYDNPAKRFLRGYRALLVRRDSLIREIERRRESATGTTVRLKEINVQSGGASDRMAEDVARIVDDEASLGDALAEIAKRLREILQAIESVPDEMQKTVLTLRYIEGLDWIAISEKVGYEERQTFVIHGRALVAVNKWMEEKANNKDSQGIMI